LTFFPPDPPLYTFVRSLNGEDLPDEDEDEDADEQDTGENGNHDISESMAPKNADVKQERENQRDIHPAEALAQRAMELRVQAKKRNKRDTLDTQLGVSYTFIPDPRLSSPPGYSGSIEAVKIPYRARTKTTPRPHVACVIYRIKKERVNDETKTIIYSHGNATDIGAMHFMQIIIAKGIKCNVVMYDYSGYGESGGGAFTTFLCNPMLCYHWNSHLDPSNACNCILLYLYSPFLCFHMQCMHIYMHIHISLSAQCHWKGIHIQILKQFTITQLNM